MTGVVSQPIPIPADFRERVAVMSNRQLRELYGVGDRPIQRWRKAVGASGERRKLDPAPEGFAEAAAMLTRHQLRETFRCGDDRINRWCLETGAVRRKRPKPFAQTPMAEMIRRPCTDAERAADFLRSKGPIYRCSERGGPDAFGSMWNRGGYVLSDADVIERATRLGWTRDAWAIAA